MTSCGRRIDRASHHAIRSRDSYCGSRRCARSNSWSAATRGSASSMPSSRRARAPRRAAAFVALGAASQLAVLGAAALAGREDSAAKGEMPLRYGRPFARTRVALFDERTGSPICASPFDKTGPSGAGPVADRFAETPDRFGSYCETPADTGLTAAGSALVSSSYRCRCRCRW